ncbi:hypothetical protein [Streptomyces sp. NPDC127036]|uniref:hypothetical protein n=1 Tax=Streptomyces sp. NPDC127036 TaxID=3347112 RepID=UPI00365BBA99
MSLSRPVKFLLLCLLAFVGGTLYLHFGKDQDWSNSLLLGLITAPVVVAAWKFRDWYTDRARRAGRNWREARDEHKRARGV